MPYSKAIKVKSDTLVPFMLFSHFVVFGRLVLLLVLALTIGSCQRQKALSPTKSQAHVQREWDGTASVVLPDGRRFALASPLLWLRHGDTNVLDPSEDPLTKRCLLLARGVPYLRNENDLVYGFEEAFSSWPRPAVEQRELCAPALGSSWRLPTVEELTAIAPQLAASAGRYEYGLTAYGKDARGQVRTFNYVVPGCSWEEGRCDFTPQVRVNDHNGAQVLCLAPGGATTVRSPSVDELRACAGRLSLFVETNYRIPHRTIDPDLVDLAASVHASCEAGFDLGRWRSLIEQLGRENREALSERALSTEAAYLEVRLAALDQAAQHYTQSKANEIDCAAQPEIYERKCALSPLSAGNTSCLMLQLRYAEHCAGVGPEARIEAVRNDLLARLEQVRRNRRRATTLGLAVRKAYQCLTASRALRSEERRRLDEQLGPLPEEQPTTLDPITPRYCICALADLECGFDALRKPEACTTERPRRER